MSPSVFLLFEKIFGIIEKLKISAVLICNQLHISPTVFALPVILVLIIAVVTAVVATVVAAVAAVVAAAVVLVVGVVVVVVLLSEVLQADPVFPSLSWQALSACPTYGFCFF